MCQEALVRVFGMRSTFFRILRIRAAASRSSPLTSADVEVDEASQESSRASPVSSRSRSLAAAACSRVEEDRHFVDRFNEAAGREILLPCAGIARACEEALAAAVEEERLFREENGVEDEDAVFPSTSVHARQVKDTVSREVI